VTPRPCGFTLVELLVALALTGLVSLLMLDGMRNAAVGLDHFSQKADELDRSHSLEALLRRELGSAVAIPLIADTERFVGRPSRLEFLSLGAGSGPGLYRIDLDFQSQREDRPLLLSRRLADPYVLPRVERSVLARGLRGFRIAYFGAIEPGSEPAWHDRWEQVRFLPTLVSITIDAGDRLNRPPIVVRLWAASG
jgi:general secretion pathway protein J